MHALNLRERFALCLDLPGAGELRGLRGYGLALARDSGSVYAVSPRLGVLAEVGLRKLGSVTRLDFPTAAADAQASALSPSGKTLYVAGGRTLWRYDLSARRLSGSSHLAAVPAALAFGGGRLYAVGKRGVTALDPATGLAVGM